MKTVMLVSAIKKKSKQHLFFVPCFFTFLNACFGFLSLVYTVEGWYSYAALCILMAVVMDMFDGRVARMLGVATGFGMELDSLADTVSFGLAPALLMYSWKVSDAGLCGCLVLMFYVCAGLFRLARFNTTTTHFSYFTGLPIPLAAAVLVAMVLDSEWLMMYDMGVNVVLSIILFLAFLMVSWLPFPSGKYHKKEALLLMGIGSTICVGVLGFFWIGLPGFTVGSLLYIAISFCLIILEKLHFFK